jgi:hypothetical protein
MPANSLDTFANTNPAFCSLVLRSFVAGYLENDSKGSPVPQLLLPLPIVLCSYFSETFKGTNAATGLITWIARHPEVTIGLRGRVQATAQFSREALVFGLSRRILDVNQFGLVVTDDRGLVRDVRFGPSDNRGLAMTNARRLGRWTANVRSTETVFTCLGLNR